MIVEAASGAGLSLCYTQVIRDILPSLEQDCDVIVLVTGGSDISLAQLEEYKKKYFKPPVIVKSGGEVFLKMDDKLTHVTQSFDLYNPMGISGDNLMKLNQKPHKIKEKQQPPPQQQQTMEDIIFASTQEEEEIDEIIEGTGDEQQQEEDNNIVITPTPTTIKTPMSLQ